MYQNHIFFRSKQFENSATKKTQKDYFRVTPDEFPSKCGNQMKHGSAAYGKFKPAKL
jgi:hypothetical protein